MSSYVTTGVLVLFAPVFIMGIRRRWPRAAVLVTAFALILAGLVTFGVSRTGVSWDQLETAWNLGIWPDELDEGDTLKANWIALLNLLELSILLGLVASVLALFQGRRKVSRTVSPRALN